MGRRYRLKSKPRAYVERDRHGRFKKWTRIGKSLRADRKKKAWHRPKKRGYGHKGDYGERVGRWL